MTRVGFTIIFGGLVILALRVFEVIHAESADIISVLLVVLGALAVAIDGEPRAPRKT